MDRFRAPSPATNFSGKIVGECPQNRDFKKILQDRARTLQIRTKTVVYVNWVREYRDRLTSWFTCKMIRNSNECNIYPQTPLALNVELAPTRQRRAKRKRHVVVASGGRNACICREQWKRSMKTGPLK